jgi:hypothetical protein
MPQFGREVVAWRRQREDRKDTGAFKARNRRDAAGAWMRVYVGIGLIDESVIYRECEAL